MRWTHVVGSGALSVWMVACSQAEVGEGAKRSITRAPLTIKRTEKADVLFVIDNSNSMAGEQAALRAQIPRLVQTLTSGQRYPDDPAGFTPIHDLHLGVVSTDMGIPGVNYPPCLADGGDNARLQHTPHPEAGLQCEASYPPYLTYDANAQQDDAKIANDFSCIATLGTGGCGFEQQLEASFKAVWPSVYKDEAGEVLATNPYYFLSTTMEGTLGRGDVPVEKGGNLGFLRDDPDDPSLLVIVLVTDEEDCSVSRTEHLKPTNQLPDDSPYRAQDINLRCSNNPQFSYDVQKRYLDGFRMLRPNHPELVVFTAIAGVPPDLVDGDSLAAVDFSDTTARDQFYDKILNDARMQYIPDGATGTGQGNLQPSCVRAVPGEEQPSTAYPPRRIVELAKGFGANGMVQSICQDDFTPAIDSIINVMAKPLDEMCMAAELARQDDGTVECSLLWNPGPALGGCKDLGVPAAELASGGCAIQQVPVRDGAPVGGPGWYYDDFTPELDRKCAGGLTRRVAYTDGVQVPADVSVELRCFGAQEQ